MCRAKRGQRASGVAATVGALRGDECVRGEWAIVDVFSALHPPWDFRQELSVFLLPFPRTQLPIAMDSVS